MEWSSPAYILNYHPHGERDAIVSLFTQEHGRYAGLVRGGQSMKHKNHWQPGHFVNVQWRARLSEHLGTLSGESVRDYTANLLDAPLGLATLLSACNLLHAALPERQAHTDLFFALEDLLPLDEGMDDLARYVRFELAVLNELGYGLDLTSCALTGATDNLAYVSPKTGRAVTQSAGAPWAARLLVLPAFLHKMRVLDWQQIYDGLVLSGLFLDQHVVNVLPATQHQILRKKRARVMELVEKKCDATIESNRKAALS
jgi:DNA repair protein RecO (recombination protein O)